MKEQFHQSIELNSILCNLRDRGLNRTHPTYEIEQVHMHVELLKERAQERLLTVAAIKPDLEPFVDKRMLRVLGYDRDQFTDGSIVEFFIRKYIQPNFQIISVFSDTMSHLFWENFYGEQSVNKQKKIPALDEFRYENQLKNRWEEAVTWMTSFPTTWAVLASKGNHDAISYWRSLVGPSWQLNTLSREYPGSLRHLYQVSEHNSLFHSSDGENSVVRELSLLSKWLQNGFKEEHCVD